MILINLTNTLNCDLKVAFTSCMCVSVCSQDPRGCAMLPCYRRWVHRAGQGEFPFFSQLFFFPPLWTFCWVNHPPHLTSVDFNGMVSVFFTELSWAWKNGLRRMYFGKTVCGFCIYSQHSAQCGFIYIESGIILGFDLFFLVEIWLQEKDRSDCMHGRICLLPRGRKSSPVTSVFKLILTEIRERDRKEVTGEKSFDSIWKQTQNCLTSASKNGELRLLVVSRHVRTVC